MRSTARGSDQAADLRRFDRLTPVQVIAVTSGKGGVGKTSVSVNLALALGNLGRKVMLFDADLGLANIDVLLGLQPKFNLSHVLEGECSLNDVILDVSDDVGLIPAASGVAQMTELAPSQHAGIIQAFSDLTAELDVLVVDTAPGINQSVISFARASQEIIVVVCDEPASITDAYALIKVLSAEHQVSRFHVLANMVRGPTEAAALFHKLIAVSDRFLDVTLSFLGGIPYDDRMRRAAQEQVAVLSGYPNTISSLAFRNVAAKAATWSLPGAARGHLEFFVERLVTASSRRAEEPS